LEHSVESFNVNWGQRTKFSPRVCGKLPRVQSLCRRIIREFAPLEPIKSQHDVCSGDAACEQFLRDSLDAVLPDSALQLCHWRRGIEHFHFDYDLTIAFCRSHRLFRRQIGEDALSLIKNTERVVSDRPSVILVLRVQPDDKDQTP
jgi:hypothetical protein